MAATRVVVHGAAGRVGLEVLVALASDQELEPAGAVDLAAQAAELPLPLGAGAIPYDTSLERLLGRCQADVVVDFTNAAAARQMAPVAASHGLHLVIGTTGLGDADLATLGDLSRRHGVGIVVAPNFALGAVVLNHLARIAARFFDHAEIFEAHHEAKIDAPSGTALKLARDIAAENWFTRPQPETEPLPGTRGGDYNGISIHSTRIPGRLAQHEVLFGAPGQTLSLRHDTISRECYMPGVLLAVKEVTKRRELVVGLESILGLG